MINMTEKVPTREHSGPFYKFLNRQKLARIRLFFTYDPRNREVFELQTVLQSMENLHVPSKRVAQVKNSSGPVAFSLCGPCKEHTEKEVSRKNNEGKGYGVRAVGTPVLVLLNKSSFRILPVYQILVNLMNGLFWQLLSTFVGLLPYGNAKWQRWDHQLEGLLSKKYFVRWLSWSLCGLKCPLGTLIQLFSLINSW